MKGKKRSNSGIDLKPVLIICGFLLLPLFLYAIYKISISGNRLIPLSSIAVIVGALIENKRLTPKWSTVFFNVFLAFILSFFAFIPGKHESNYSIDSHIFIWPYTFLLFFIIISIYLNKTKLIPRLSEANTLILSAGFVYWLIDHAYYNSSSSFLKTLIIIGILLTAFSAANAFTKIELTKPVRLTLSIWSSIVMMLLAVDNIVTIYQHGEIEDAFTIMDKIDIALQYFLLGVCSIYITQNILMVITYLPSKGRFFNHEYFKEVKEMTKDHLNRYSEEQSSIMMSAICLVIATTFFIINYNFELIHRNTAIWMTFFILNNVIFYFEIVKPVVKDN